MTYYLVLTGKFKKGLKLAKKRGLNIALLDSVVEKLLHGLPLDEKNRDHELKGEFNGFRKCHIREPMRTFLTCKRYCNFLNDSLNLYYPVNTTRAPSPCGKQASGALVLSFRTFSKTRNSIFSLVMSVIRRLEALPRPVPSGVCDGVVMQSGNFICLPVRCAAVAAYKCVCRNPRPWQFSFIRS